MKLLFTLTLGLLITSCANQLKVVVKKPQVVDYKHGTIHVTPISSKPALSDKYIVKVRLDILNDTNKIIKFNAQDAILITKDKQTVEAMTKEDLMLYVKSENPNAGDINREFSKLTDGLLVKGRIIPHGSKTGYVFYKIPSKTKTDFRISFYNSLKSRKIASFNKNTIELHNPAYAGPDKNIMKDDKNNKAQFSGSFNIE